MKAEASLVIKKKHINTDFLSSLSSENRGELDFVIVLELDTTQK